MAEMTGSPGVTARLEEQLTCPVCLDHYASPKTLPCLHSFCHQCLEGLPLELQGEKFVLTCPTCRSLTELPEKGASAFPTAFHINNLAEIHGLLKKVSGKKQVECDNCNEVGTSANATGYCKVCTKFLCSNCIEIHNKWGPTSKHQMLSLDELADTAVELVPVKQEVISNCSNHNKPLEIYCETCQKLICHNCTVRIHKEHDYDVIDDVYRKHQREIESCLEPVREQIDVVTKALDTLDSSQKRIIEVGDNIKCALKGFFKALQEIEQKCYSEVDIIVKNKLEILSQQSKSVEILLSELKDCEQFTDQCLKLGSPAQVLASKQQMTERMDEVVKRVNNDVLEPLEELESLDDNEDFDQEEMTEELNKLEELWSEALEVTYSETFYKQCRVEINSPEVIVTNIAVIKFYIWFQDRSVLLPTSDITCVIRDAVNDEEIEDPEYEITQSYKEGKHVYTIEFIPDEDEENEETDDENDVFDFLISDEDEENEETDEENEEKDEENEEKDEVDKERDEDDHDIRLYHLQLQFDGINIAGATCEIKVKKP